MSRHLERDQLLELIDEVGVGVQQHISDDDCRDNGSLVGDDVYAIHCMLENLKTLIDESMTDAEEE